MARVPWPSNSPEEWQVLVLGGIIFPGLCFAKGPKGGQKLDVKDAPGADGESTTQQGEKAKTGQFLIRMWTPEQWEEFDDAYDILEPRIGKRTPLDVATAATAQRNVSSILIETIEGPNWDAEKQWMEYVVDWREHKPPPPKNATQKNAASVASIGAQYEHMPAAKPREKRLVYGDDEGVVYTKARKLAQQGIDQNRIAQNRTGGAT